ncbi:MAG: metal ABC transporter ATP-binding protein [Candidatus Methylacidiphilales bacterium]
MIHLGYAGRHHAPPVPGAPALVVENLSIRYAGAEEDALRDVSLSVPAGSRVALVGPNGAGKSTLLKAAAGLLPTTATQVRIYGNRVGACHHRVTYLEQRSEVDWNFPVTVERLVMTGRYVHLGWFRRPGPRDRQIVEAALTRMGLDHLAKRQIRNLSGGQQQRALLARALAQEADLLLFDEPLNALDSETQGAVLSVLRELHREGKTLVMATHELDRLEAEFDAAYRFEQGRVRLLA